MPTKIEKDAITGTNTTGHEWDGIKELDTPMPKWWVYTFYACILFAIVYVALFPSVPGLHGYFGGLLHFSQRQAVEASMKEAVARQGVFLERVAKADLKQIRETPDLFSFAVTGGKAAFNINCAQCHQPGGGGIKGFPNLADDDWLWGGSLEAIHQTITYGVRNANEQSRQSMMPRFGTDGMLKPAEISDVADYVLSLSGKSTAPAASVQRGAAIFADQCEACHNKGGTGNLELGAPRLNDKIWLYGGDKATLVETIAKARNSNMPAWGERLDPTTIKMLAVYVHALGGGQ